MHLPMRLTIAGTSHWSTGHLLFVTLVLGLACTLLVVVGHIVFALAHTGRWHGRLQAGVGAIALLLGYVGWVITASRIPQHVSLSAEAALAGAVIVVAGFAIAYLHVLIRRRTPETRAAVLGVTLGIASPAVGASTAISHRRPALFGGILVALADLVLAALVCAAYWTALSAAE